MKILYFSRDYTTHDHRFLSVLADSEHQVGFLQLEYSGHPLEDRPLPAGVQHIRWVGGQTPARIVDGLRLIAGLKKVIREFNPDLIQAGPVQRSAFLVALIGFHPLVTMSWGYDLLVDAHKGSGWGWATRFTLKRSDALIVDCDTIRLLAGKYGMDEDRIVSFPWGVNLQKFTPTKVKGGTNVRKRLGWGKDKFVLLSTRGWSELYGVEDLARAFVIAARKQPNLRLLMLGNGPLASKIRRIFTQGGVQDLVHFPGQISQDKLPDYYRSADLYISTSHSDGTSISLLEALSSGTPVLLTDIPGNQEWVTKPGKVGWTFQDGQAQSLVKGILHAVEQRDVLPKMAVAARQLAEARANWDSNALEMFEAYKIAAL